MPVQVQAEDPSLSRWLLATEQLGRSWEFSWLAQNLAPIQYQKVGAWHSAYGRVMNAFLEV